MHGDPELSLFPFPNRPKMDGKEGWELVDDLGCKKPGDVPRKQDSSPIALMAPENVRYAAFTAPTASQYLPSCSVIIGHSGACNVGLSHAHASGCQGTKVDCPSLTPHSFHDDCRHGTSADLR